MKNKNKRELERHWAEQQKKQARLAKTAPKKKSPGDAKPAAPAAQTPEGS